MERIEEYDVLANLLLDMNYNIEGRATLANEGIGYNSSAGSITDPSDVPTRNASMVITGWSKTQYSWVDPDPDNHLTFH